MSPTTSYSPSKRWLGLAISLAALVASPSQAQVLAFAKSSDGASIVLREDAGPCSGKARLAEHFTPVGERTAGCWLMTREMVLISFFDGERADIPLVHLKRLSGT